MRLSSAGLLVTVALLVYAPSVWAQGVEDIDAPIGRFVADLHGVVVPWGQNPDLAIVRGFDPSTQPNLGLGIGGGAHVYLLRWRFVTVGLGASVLYASGSQSPGPDDPDPQAPALRKTLTAVVSQLSLNFGRRNGWSYISAGPGSSTFSLYDQDFSKPPQRSTRTFSYGGGARWFTNDHLAFALDMRFYNATPLQPTETEPGSPRITTMVLSIGASFK